MENAPFEFGGGTLSHFTNFTTDAGHMHLYTFLLMVLAYQFLLNQVIFKPALAS